MSLEEKIKDRILELEVKVLEYKEALSDDNVDDSIKQVYYWANINSNIILKELKQLSN